MTNTLLSKLDHVNQLLKDGQNAMWGVINASAPRRCRRKAWWHRTRGCVHCSALSEAMIWVTRVRDFQTPAGHVSGLSIARGSTETI
jgi:hypothetical protein